MSWTEFHPLVQEAIRTTFAVGLLVFLVLVIRKPFAKRFGAKAGYLLWSLPLARFVTPPLPGNWSLSGFLGFNRQASPSEAPSLVAANETAPFAPSETVSTAPSVDPVATTQWTPETLAAPNPTAPIAPEVASAGTSLLEATLAQAPLILICVWLTGVVLWLGRSIYQQRQFLELIEADSEAADTETVAETAKLAKQLGLRHVPEVRASLLCSGPLVTGLKNPVVLLPMWFEEDYTPAERRDALIHELMHLKRRDLWAFQAARIVAATQWFNPLVHVGLKAFRTDQEAACDADVINRAKLSPAAYGRTLVKAARLARPSDRRIAAASLTLAHPIKERLIMMTHPTPSLRSRLLGGTLAIALGAGAVFATASSVSVAQELDGGTEDKTSSRTVVIDGKNDLNFAVTVDGETFSFNMADLPPMPPMPVMPPMPGMEFEQDGNSFHMVFDTDKIEAMEDSPEFAEWESKMEAWGEEMETWGDMVGDRADAWSEQMEPQIEAWAEKHAEKWENQVELMVERVEREAERAERNAERAEARAEREVERAERQRERAERKTEQNRERAERYSSNGQSKNLVSKPETRDFGSKAFDEIELGSGLSLVYSQDPKASVTAKLERGSWDDIDIKVESGTLKVEKKNKRNWNNGMHPKLTVYASSKGLKSIDVASGSSFKGSVIADGLRVDASSGSSLNLEGACKGLNLDASSGSSVTMSKLECETVNVDASSGSSISVYASKRVNVDGSSGSSIRVAGSPKTIDKDLSSGASLSIQ